MTEYFEVEVESLSLEGKGISHCAGKVVFIDGALPGERVRYELVKSKPRYEVGRIVDVLRPSVDRVVPRCAHFGFTQGTCGGCYMQHLDTTAQLAIKQRAGRCAVTRGEGAPAKDVAAHRWSNLGLPLSGKVVGTLCAA